MFFCLQFTVVFPKLDINSPVGSGRTKRNPLGLGLDPSGRIVGILSKWRPSRITRHSENGLDSAA
jgi:hypothetical protein